MMFARLEQKQLCSLMIGLSHRGVLCEAAAQGKRLKT